MERRRFLELWRRCRCGACEAEAAAVFTELQRRYDEPWRHYHTVAHIAYCLERFDEVRDRLHQPDAVELALWFHDAVYDPRADDNEARSAALALACLDEEADPALRDRVRELILATRHCVPPRDHDQRYLCDIDLCSFARPWALFLRDTRALRAEKAFVPDAEFYPRRLRMLETLLARPHFFHTSAFRWRFEAAVRANLQRAVAALRARGYG
ncbi:MAG TPA: hypothetical protein VNN09_09190 [Candidatus Competibacteraceae bacterium]|nr:hypothetical protein [Candidatus Competibacteraceae bacterium]